MDELDLYKKTKVEVVDFLGGLAPEVLQRSCRHCAAWSNQSVFAHHVDTVAMFLAGEFPAAAGRAIVAADPAIVRGSTYELLRCVTGRRTRTEADGILDWGQAPDSGQDLFPVYGWPG